MIDIYIYIIISICISLCVQKKSCLRACYCAGAGSLLCKIASAKRSRTNVARNLFSVIYKSGESLQVEIELVKTTVQLRKPRKRIEQVFWPCLSMRSWITLLMERYPEFLLGGFKVEEESKWREQFRLFWQKYRAFDGSHSVFTDGTNLEFAIPYFIHGDEGRGLGHQPLMVEAWQTAISYKGVGYTNVSGFLSESMDHFCLFCGEGIRISFLHVCFVECGKG